MEPSNYQQQDRYDARSLIQWATHSFTEVGLDADKAKIVSETLVEGDLMGHTTHGLQLLPAYLDCLAEGDMLATGEPEILSDHGAAMTWNGRYLPGPWLVVNALNLAIERSVTHPVVTLTIHQSHHIGCLAAYPKLATDNNLVMWLSCSDPFLKTVAPFGGIEPLYTPNPIAAGFPSSGEPIIFDISMSSVANGAVARAHRQHKPLGGKWLLDKEGNATDDPATLFSDEPGTVLPLGGTDLGYKGFALGIMVEALTSALGGHGRSDNPTKWGASVFLQVINPDAFGGADHFLKEMDWFSAACQENSVQPGNPSVRLPGHQALKLRRDQLENGIMLDLELIDTLKKRAVKMEIPFPDPL